MHLTDLLNLCHPHQSAEWCLQDTLNLYTVYSLNASKVMIVRYYKIWLLLLMLIIFYAHQHTAAGVKTKQSVKLFIIII